MQRHDGLPIEDIAEVTINRAVVEGKKLPLVRKKQDKDAA